MRLRLYAGEVSGLWPSGLFVFGNLSVAATNWRGFAATKMPAMKKWRPAWGTGAT